MLRLFAQLLLFIAVLVAPLGMTAAPAANAHHATGAGTALEHCPDQGQTDAGGIVDCTMACAAALPALQGARDAQPPAAHRAGPVIASRRLAGILQEIATPPPKSI